MVGARLVILATLVAGCGHVAPTGGLPAASLAATAGAPSAEPSPSAATSARDVPAGFPVPPGAEPAAPAPGAFAAWTSDETPPAIYEHFLAALPAAGFQVDAAHPGGEAAVIRFTGPDGTAYQINQTGRGPVRIELGPVRP